MKPFCNTSFECQALSFVASTLKAMLERLEEQITEFETPGLGHSRWVKDRQYVLQMIARKCVIIGFFSLQIAWPDLATAFEQDALEDMYVQGE